MTPLHTYSIFIPFNMNVQFNMGVPFSLANVLFLIWTSTHEGQCSILSNLAPSLYDRGELFSVLIGLIQEFTDDATTTNRRADMIGPVRDEIQRLLEQFKLQEQQVIDSSTEQPGHGSLANKMLMDSLTLLYFDIEKTGTVGDQQLEELVGPLCSAGESYHPIRDIVLELTGTIASKRRTALLESLFQVIENFPLL